MSFPPAHTDNINCPAPGQYLTYGSSCLVACSPDSTLISGSSLLYTCGANGQIIEPDGVCKRKCAVRTFGNDVIGLNCSLGTDYAISGQSCTVGCAPGSDMVSGTITAFACEDGVPSNVPDIQCAKSMCRQTHVTVRVHVFVFVCGCSHTGRCGASSSRTRCKLTWLALFPVKA